MGYIVKKLNIFLFHVFFFCYVFPLNSQTSFDNFDQFIEKARLRYHVPGLSVAVVKDNKVVFIKGYGKTKVDSSENVDENTIFQLASVSKTFASAGLGVLVDQKKLEWDDEIIKHLPEFALKEPYSSRYATARDLLAHRTGLPAFKGDLLGHIGYSPEEILFRARYMEPASSFRNEAFYSNLGYFISGCLLSKLENSTWEESIKKNLLDPLEMTRSGFGKNLNNSNVAFAHAKIGDEIKVIPWNKSEVFVAAGGVTSTARDMSKWILMHLNKGIYKVKSVLKNETVKEMHAPSMISKIGFAELPPISDKSLFNYTLGWTSYQYHGKVIVEKGGALEGVRSIVTLIPELNAGIVVLANLNLTVIPELIRAKYLEMLLGNFEEDLIPIFDHQQQKISDLIAPSKKPNTILPMKHRLDEYVGKYESDLYGTLNIVLENGKEDLQVLVGLKNWQGNLHHWSDDTFMLIWPLINMGPELVTFTFGPDGKALKLETEFLGTFSRFQSH